MIGGTLLLLNAAGTTYSKSPDNLPKIVVPADQLATLPSEMHDGKSYKVWSPGTPADAPFGGQKHAYEKAGRMPNNLRVSHRRFGRHCMVKPWPILAFPTGRWPFVPWLPFLADR